MCGQTFNLLNVEYGVALHEVDFTLRIIAGMLIDFLAGDGIGIHDQRALSLARPVRDRRLQKAR